MEQFLKWFNKNISARWFRLRAKLPWDQYLTPKLFNIYADILEGKAVSQADRDLLYLAVNGVPRPKAEAATAEQQ
jgi:hypothetical protein